MKILRILKLYFEYYSLLSLDNVISLREMYDKNLYVINSNQKIMEYPLLEYPFLQN